MGVLPLQVEPGKSWKDLGLVGDELVTIDGVPSVKVRQSMMVQIKRANGETLEAAALCRIDTENELDYFNNGGILQFVLRNLAKAA
jgi:aconitate hydratase